MADKRWKRVERVLARDVGSQRIPVTGERHGADFEDAIACYQVKSRKAIPGWLWEWHAGIQGTATAKDKAGVVVLHQPGQRRSESLVVLMWKDWVDIVGEPGGGDGLHRSDDPAAAGVAAVDGREPARERD